MSTLVKGIQISKGHSNYQADPTFNMYCPPDQYDKTGRYLWSKPDLTGKIINKKV